MSFSIKNLNSLICPITLDIFIEPVIGSDCHTYERIAIINWLQIKEISPITYESMSINSLRSNLAMKNTIEELYQFDEINTNTQPPPIPPRQPRIPPIDSNYQLDNTTNNEDDTVTMMF